jgi:hypothetical protein
MAVVFVDVYDFGRALPVASLLHREKSIFLAEDGVAVFLT